MVMVARYAQRYLVSSRSDLVMAREAIASGSERLLIEAAPDSPVLTRMDEFRDLASTVSQSDAEVSFTSDDPLRVELARIAGLTVIAPDPVTSGVRRAIDSTEATRKIDRPQPETRPMPEVRNSKGTTADITDDESWASFSFVVNPPVPRRPDLAQNTWYYDGALIPVTQRRSGSHHRAGKAAGIAAVIVIMLLLVSSGLMAAVVIPRTNVTLTPIVVPVEAGLTYGVAGYANGVDVTIDPVSISSEITYSATIPTTGIRTEPDGFATGELALMNPSTVEIFLPAGTVLSTVDGLSFATTWDITIPAADPFGSGAMGTAVVELQATTAGPDANIQAYALEGQLDNGLFFQNREAFSGGTVREIPTVAEADLETLRSQAAASLAGRPEAEIAPLIPAGFELIDGSLQTGDMQTAFNLEPGMDATELTINVVLPISAQAFDPVALQEMAEAELANRLAGAVPVDTELLENSISIGTPEVTGQYAFELEAGANARAIIDPQIIEALRHDLIGASEEQAAAQVVLLGNVAGFEIEHGPDWLPFDWPPRLESRIAITIDDSTTTTQAPGTTGP
jgi:hypothetical protein